MKTITNRCSFPEPLARCWKRILPLTLLFLLTTGLGTFAQGTQFTYQGRVTDHGTNFNGTGLFKFALVTSTNTSHQATATATLTGAFVTACTVTYGGTGYVTPPAVSFSGGGGSGAAATAVISGGVVTAITVTDAGASYTSPPTVTIAPPPANILYTTYWSNDGTSANGSQPASAVSLPVNSGLLMAGLGDATLANMTSIPVVVFLQPGLQLQIWFNDGVSGFALMNPLQNLTPAPCAVMANCASNLLGTVPSTSLSGTYSGAVNLNNTGNTFSGNGSGLISLNASQLTSGTVADNRLSGNVAKLNVNQTFTGTNTFGGYAGSFIVNNGYSIINTNLFTGLGLQYYIPTGEGAIMSSYNDGFGFLSFYTKQGGQPITKRMVITTGGNVGIGTTTPDALLTVNGTADKPGGGSWGTYSDRRLKDVGARFNRGLEALQQIQPVHYHYKADNPLTLSSKPEYVGVVAQEVQLAIPEAVQSCNDGYLTVDNDPIIWTMLNSIKELNRRLEAKTAESEALRGRVEALERLVAGRNGRAQ